jgi:hypothetical protein
MAARLPTLARHLVRRSTFPSILSARAPTAPLRAAAAAAPAASYATDSSNSNKNTPSPFTSNPSPLRLPPDEQAEFERLQRAANTQEPLDPVAAEAALGSSSSEGASAAAADTADADSASNLPLRQGAPPEFEGDVNPRTGEVGGPKNEPLRWGSGGDWSYNGRVTDF